MCEKKDLLKHFTTLLNMEGDVCKGRDGRGKEGEGEGEATVNGETENMWEYKIILSYDFQFLYKSCNAKD